MALVALLLVHVPQASADYIPPTWSYATTFTTTGPYAVNNSPPGDGITHSINDGNISVVLYGFRSFPETGSVGSVSSLYMQAYASSPWTGEVGNFSPDKNIFDLTVALTDKASGTSGSLVFHGGIGGSYSVGRYDQNASEFGPGYLATNLTYPYFSSRTQSLRLGELFYTVSLLPYAFDANTVSMSVLVSGENPLSPVSTVPEPSTLALAVAGLAELGLRQWRQRRRAV
jgi:hypothetical protein